MKKIILLLTLILMSGLCFGQISKQSRFSSEKILQLQAKLSSIHKGHTPNIDPSGRYWTCGCHTNPEHNSCKGGSRECNSCVGAHNSNAKCCCYPNEQ
jgi:hypothetical protein